jgi:hypothetical protein
MWVPGWTAPKLLSFQRPAPTHFHPSPPPPPAPRPGAWWPRLAALAASRCRAAPPASASSTSSTTCCGRWRWERPTGVERGGAVGAGGRVGTDGTSAGQAGARAQRAQRVGWGPVPAGGTFRPAVPGPCATARSIPAAGHSCFCPTQAACHDFPLEIRSSGVPVSYLSLARCGAATDSVVAAACDTLAHLT